MTEKPLDVYGRYSDEAPRDQPWCSAGIVLVGEWYPCDLIPPHDGWAHSNREIEALWKCADQHLKKADFDRIKNGRGLTDEDGKDALYRHWEANERRGDG